MTWKDDIALAYLSPHDFLFYCSREYNTRGIVEPNMGNYALMYAVNTDIPDIHRAAAGVAPNYTIDFSKISTYLTPAFPVTGKAVMHDQIVTWKTPDPVDFTYNAVGEELTFGMAPAKMNFPNLGCYEKFCPLTTFSSFIIGPRRPSIIRWGKKPVPCRVRYIPVKNVSIHSGIFHPIHPVNSAELSLRTQLRGGTILFVKPSNLVLNPEIEGSYIQGTVEERTVQIAIPNYGLYPGVFPN